MRQRPLVIGRVASNFELDGERSSLPEPTLLDELHENALNLMGQGYLERAVEFLLEPRLYDGEPTAVDDLLDDSQSGELLG